MLQGVGYSIWSVYLHVWQILEDEGLVKLWIEIFPVDLCLVLWFLIRKKVNLDEGVSEACGPVSRWQLATLDNLEVNKVNQQRCSTGRGNLQ